MALPKIINSPAPTSPLKQNDMITVEQRAEDYVNKQWSELKGKLRKAAIRGYIDGYKSAPHPFVQLGLNFD